jgi:antiviral helicase SKI2
MADLASALENLQLNATGAGDEWIDQIIEEQRQPRKRIKQDQEELKRDLEKKYLTPSRSFSKEWLNKLQQ